MKTLWWIIVSLFKTREQLEVENLALGQQVTVPHRSAPRRLYRRASDRLLFVWLYRLWPGALDSIVIVKPETVVRWHRSGFKAFADAQANDGMPN